MAASWTVAADRLVRWRAGFDEMFGLVAGEFAQVESRRRARMYLLGLLSAERKNGWTIAEQAGELSPDGMQRLLNHYRWDADPVRDTVRRYVLDRLGDPAGVVVADETGFLKKGTKSAGAQRQLLRYRRTDRGLSTRRVPDLRLAAWTRADRPRVVPAQVMDRRLGPLRRGGNRHRCRVCDQAGVGPGACWSG
ncbi:MAG: transposase [Labedaea sp.]